MPDAGHLVMLEHPELVTTPSPTARRAAARCARRRVPQGAARTGGAADRGAAAGRGPAGHRRRVALRGHGPRHADRHGTDPRVTVTVRPEQMRELGRRLATLLRARRPGAAHRRARRGQDHADPRPRRGPGRTRRRHLADLRDRPGPPLAGGGPPLVHVDAYRLGGGLDEMEDLDLDVSLPESVIVVEWGEGKVEELSEDRLQVVIERAVGERRGRRGPAGRRVTRRRRALGDGDLASLAAEHLGGARRLDAKVPTRLSGRCCAGTRGRGLLDPGRWLGLPNFRPARPGGIHVGPRPPRSPQPATRPRRCRGAAVDEADPAGGARRRPAAARPQSATPPEPPRHGVTRPERTRRRRRAASRRARQDVPRPPCEPRGRRPTRGPRRRRLPDRRELPHRLAVRRASPGCRPSSWPGSGSGSEPSTAALKPTSPRPTSVKSTTCSTWHAVRRRCPAREREVTG